MAEMEYRGVEEACGSATGDLHGEVVEELARRGVLEPGGQAVTA